MLLNNYRSHEALLQLPSRLFYDGRLVAAVAPESVQPPAWDLLQRAAVTRAAYWSFSISSLTYVNIPMLPAHAMAEVHFTCLKRPYRVPSLYSFTA